MPLNGKDVVLYEKKGNVVQITLNRPERLNSITIEMYDRLEECWREFRDDPEARVAILTGTGKAFCAGMDLKDNAERVARDPSFDMVKLRPGVLDGTTGTPYGQGVWKPVIAAINGVATAGGFNFALYCDLRIAAPEAVLGVAEVKVGRGSPWSMPLLYQLPLAIAFELTMRGEMVPVQRLAEHGFINKIVPLEELLPTAHAWAQGMAENAPLSMMAVKRAFYSAIDSNLFAAKQMAREIYSKVYTSQDAIEGPKAFSEKRKPVWKGK
ncbi:MAG: enoyl-CoA hydratase-related protein [Dehalococcoidia bacterium]|nr:enoyl-CoA hydratase-related protein [Dehalococcoidia bacterium]